MVEKFGNTILKKERLAEQKVKAFVQLIQELPNANDGDGELFYELASQKMTGGEILKLRKLIEYSRK